MALRTFRDSDGRAWRAWDVVPDELAPRTRDEDFLAQLYLTGWIVFESADGRDKRRLYPIPDRWQELPDAELEVLVRKAEVVPARKLEAERRTSSTSSADGDTTLTEQLIDHPESAGAIIRDQTPDVTDLPAVRTFRYPGGRLWTVCVISHPDDGGSPVLRFSAGVRAIDLARWPRDWVDLPEEALVLLLREAAPRSHRGAPPPGIGGRRWDDATR